MHRHVITTVRELEELTGLHGPLVPVSMAADLTGIHRVTLWRRIEAGTLVSVVYLGRVLVPVTSCNVPTPQPLRLVSVLCS